MNVNSQHKTFGGQFICVVKLRSHMLQILKIIAVLLTVATGGLSLFKPMSTSGFNGLEPFGGRGVSEIRSVLGGLFIALGLALLIIKR